MSGENDFTPRLGRIGDRGGRAAQRYGARVRKAAAKRAKPKTGKPFSGAAIARGTAAGRAAAFREQRLSAFRMRRVVVKAHIARARRGAGKAAFRAHVKYIQRDGVARADERGESRGDDLYTADRDRIADDGFLARSEDDRHQFRIILAPEDGDALGDLKETTRAFMRQAEKDLGSRLDWVAVDHWNTGHPHTHIVIRGRDARGKDLVIAREYLTQGMRRRAQDLVTERLGPRRDLEIARSRRLEVDQERFTGIDRRIAADIAGGAVEIGEANGAAGRFERSLRIARLRRLENLKLAERDGPMRWRLKEGWQDSLKALGRRGDIIRSIAAVSGDAYRGPVSIFSGADARQRPVLGRVAATGPGDELRDTRFLVIDGLDGRRWHVGLGALEPGAAPPVGAIVEAAPARAGPKRSDRVIAAVAALNGGLYSDALHAEDDPASTRDYRDAHKRRLEALRRAGLVERRADGVFLIPPDFLERAASFEARRGEGVKIEVKSWIGIDAQIGARAPAWLDAFDAGDSSAGGFGAEAAKAQRARLAFLRREGLLPEGAARLEPASARALEKAEHASAAAAEAARSGRAHRTLDAAGRFEGVYEGTVDLAQGRFARIGRAKEFTLVPWRPEIERARGQAMTIRRTGRGVEWTLGKARGLGR